VAKDDHLRKLQDGHPRLLRRVVREEARGRILLRRQSVQQPPGPPRQFGEGGRRRLRLLDEKHRPLHGAAFEGGGSRPPLHRPADRHLLPPGPGARGRRRRCGGPADQGRRRGVRAEGRRLAVRPDRLLFPDAGGVPPRELRAARRGAGGGDRRGGDLLRPNLQEGRSEPRPRGPQFRLRVDGSPRRCQARPRLKAR